MSPSTTQVFRPVFGWLVLSFLLFLWRYHYTQAAKATLEFQVAVAGRASEAFPDATLNGRRYQAGYPCGVGWKKLVINAADAEPFETNRFIWYGGAAFGNITLARSRGQLDLDFVPAIETVQVTGTEEQKSLDKSTHQSLSLPTGTYKVWAKFTLFSIEQTVEIKRNQTNRISLAPKLAALQLSSDPDNAEFELQSTHAPRVSLKGNTPTTISALPLDEYELVVARGDFRKHQSVRLSAADKTNAVTVQFRYAKLAITSDPAGTTISAGDKVLGKTPANLELQPGSHRLSLTKEGYFGTNVNLELAETDQRTLAVTLVNTSFVAALERARTQATGFNPDYDRALADVEHALQIKPGDAGALRLQGAIQLNRHLKRAREFRGEGDLRRALAATDSALQLDPSDATAVALKSDLEQRQRVVDAENVKARQALDSAQAKARAEARRQHPQQVLQATVAGVRHQDAFPTQSLRVKGSVASVRSSLLAIFRTNKPEWPVKSERPADADTVILEVTSKSVTMRRHVFFVIGQTGENEVVIAFKLFAYVLGEKIGISLSGFSDESYIPMNSRFFTQGRVKTIDGDYTRESMELVKQIEDALR